MTNWTVIDTLPADATNYSDTSLICSSNYYYRVRAYRAGDSSYTNYSNIAPESTYECSFPAPTGLTATTASATVINLSWTDNTTDETSFHIERSPNGTDSWVEIDTVGSDQTSYADTSVSCETDYYYRVRAFRNDDATFSNYSNVDGDTSGICPLAPPSSLNAAATSQTEISLSWVDNSPDETAFHIERSPNGTDSWTEIGTVSADVTNYVDSPLTCGTTAYYRIRGYRSSNSTYSTYSNTSSDTTEYCPLAAPTNLTGTAKNKKVIQISWTDNSIDETEFRIERSPNGVDSWVEIGTAAADATSFTENQLTCGTTYYYRVRAYRVIDDAYSDYTLVISVQTDPC